MLSHSNQYWKSMRNVNTMHDNVEAQAAVKEPTAGR